jgi:hypothetical protein
LISCSSNKQNYAGFFFFFFFLPASGDALTHTHNILPTTTAEDAFWLYTTWWLRDDSWATRIIKLTAVCYSFPID